MGRYEIISGVERYRRRSYEEKALILREASVPGAVISHVARQHDIRPQQIYQWRRQLLAPELPVFVPVTLNPVLPGVAVPGGPAAVPVEVLLAKWQVVNFHRELMEWKSTDSLRTRKPAQPETAKA